MEKKKSQNFFINVWSDPHNQIILIINLIWHIAKELFLDRLFGGINAMIDKWFLSHPEIKNNVLSFISNNISLIISIVVSALLFYIIIRAIIETHREKQKEKTETQTLKEKTKEKKNQFIPIAILLIVFAFIIYDIYDLTVKAHVQIVTPTQPASTSTPILMPILTPTITPLPLAQSGYEYMDYYYQCINYARQPFDLRSCFSMLSLQLQNVTKDINGDHNRSDDYANSWWNLRFRYRIYECPEQSYYGVGVEYIIYPRADIDFQNPIDENRNPQYYLYRVIFDQGRWIIQSDEQGSIDNCNLKYDRWSP